MIIAVSTCVFVGVGGFILGIALGYNTAIYEAGRSRRKKDRSK